MGLSSRTKDTCYKSAFWGLFRQFRASEAFFNLQHPPICLLLLTFAHRLCYYPCLRDLQVLEQLLTIALVTLATLIPALFRTSQGSRCFGSRACVLHTQLIESYFPYVFILGACASLACCCSCVLNTRPRDHSWEFRDSRSRTSEHVHMATGPRPVLNERNGVTRLADYLRS